MNYQKLDQITQNLLIRQLNGSPKTNVNKANLNKAAEIELKLIEVRDSDYIINPLPFDYINQFDKDTINLVMQSIGLYTFPTCELIDWLKNQIDDDPGLEPHSAIEICAGTGWIGRTLGIPITDLRIQEDPAVIETYLKVGAKPIEYPNDIEKLEALEAVKKYKPDIVIGSYVTNKWGMKNSSKKRGSEFGVNTINIINNCWKYILIGNDDIHKGQPEMKRPHKRLSFPWLVTRGDISKARIYIWENKSWFK